MQNKKRKFTKSLTFKVLCGLVVIVLLGIGYNLIVDDKDSPLSEEEQEEEQQRTADKDTIDIVGDYLWPHAKSSKDDLTAKDDKDKDADEVKDKKAMRRQWLHQLLLPQQRQIQSLPVSLLHLR